MLDIDCGGSVRRPRPRMSGAEQLRADGFDVRDKDVARLSPGVRHHMGALGRYSCRLPGTGARC
ncbi:hypothetical protein ABZX85_42470 [Streptomyces sp. NPDC004539]|uniref:hypothetical protein n=1 Tax=Streptomyces sp. NPDC004539 TaxID=3154280 RepID=UPI00339FD334